MSTSNNQAGRCGSAWLAKLHRDESGSISILAVFALIMLVMLMGMVLNSAVQIDQKVKMQNAADAAAYSGSVVFARSMNTLAFTNHLISDVFALTAFMREASDRSAEKLTPEILDNWKRVGPHLAGSEFDKFADLGVAIEEKVPHEREVVLRFSDWAQAASELMLPVFEQILAERQIPEFQRAVLRVAPSLAQGATDEIARRHGDAWPRPTELRGVLWRTNGDFVGGMTEADRRLLPVVDPVMDPLPDRNKYVKDARQQRFRLAHRYLRQWNSESLPIFDSYAKMSQFGGLWRIFTGGHLQKLLEEDYPDTNLPIQIRTKPGEVEDLNAHLERDFMLIAVVYRDKLSDYMPGVFRNPTGPDTQAYAQVMMFVPRRRLIKSWLGSADSRPGRPMQTGVPGQGLEVEGPPPAPTPPKPPPKPPPTSPSDQQPKVIVIRQSVHFHPEPWTLINQNWTSQLVPATSSSILDILGSPPYQVPTMEPPELAGVKDQDFQWLSNH